MRPSHTSTRCAAVVATLWYVPVTITSQYPNVYLRGEARAHGAQSPTVAPLLPYRSGTQVCIGTHSTGLTRGRGASPSVMQWCPPPACVHERRDQPLVHVGLARDVAGQAQHVVRRVVGVAVSQDQRFNMRGELRGTRGATWRHVGRVYPPPPRGTVVNVVVREAVEHKGLLARARQLDQRRVALTHAQARQHAEHLPPESS